MNELNAILTRLVGPAGGGVLATLVTVAGSSYRRSGARLLLPDGGDRIGSISGGCLEEDVISRARKVAETGAAELVTYDTTSENDLVWGVGLGCHGIVQVLLERVPPNPVWAKALAEALAARHPTELAVVWGSNDRATLGTRLRAELATDAAADGVFLQTVQPAPMLVIFGAGDDARPLVRFAKELGWYVSVADPRPDFATRTRFPSADALVIAPAAELVGRIAPGPDAIAVVMTHRYVHDVPVLHDLLTRELAYVGLLGPKQRAHRILADLRRRGAALAPGYEARFHAPVGLDLGAETPEEVALSIIAEIRAVLAGRDARPLRERTRPIHA